MKVVMGRLLPQQNYCWGRRRSCRRPSLVGAPVPVVDESEYSPDTEEPSYNGGEDQRLLVRAVAPESERSSASDYSSEGLQMFMVL